jgi:hypothetical protein
MLLFDELVGYADFRNHEMLAMYLWLGQTGAQLCAVAKQGLMSNEKVAYPERYPSDPGHQKRRSFQLFTVLLLTCETVVQEKLE